MRFDAMSRTTLVLLLAVGLALPVGATLIERLDAAQLADKAELIFLGRAVHRQAVATLDGRYPLTFVTFEIDEVLKGAVDGSSLTLRFEGGELADEVVLVQGMPQFDHGQSYLLFVAGNGRAICPLVGWGQGQLSLLPHPSRAGEQVLIDHRGAVVESLADGKWGKTAVERDGRGMISLAQKSGVEILEEVGVTIEDPEAIDPDRELVPAGAVFRQLRSLLRERSSLASFKAGATVTSASLLEIPKSYRALRGKPEPTHPNTER